MGGVVDANDVAAKEKGEVEVSPDALNSNGAPNENREVFPSSSFLLRPKLKEVGAIDGVVSAESLIVGAVSVVVDMPKLSAEAADVTPARNAEGIVGEGERSCGGMASCFSAGVTSFSFSGAGMSTGV